MPELRPGSGFFGVPAMIAVFAFIAFAIRGGNILVALAVVVVVYLVIGLAMTMAKKSG
jgi:hypothetical protein